MNFRNYLKEHFLEIFLFFLILFFLSAIFMILNISLENILFVLFLIIIFNLFIFVFNYQKRKLFFKEFFSILNKLDQKYFITEMIKTTNFLEGKLFLQALYEIDKSMKEELNKKEKSIRNFKEYLELWIHEIKLPIASLVLKNHNKKENIEELKEIKKIEEYVEQVLYYVRSENSENDYLIHECNLKTIVKNVILRNKDDFLALDIKIETKDLNKMVLTDSKWLEYILNQIISNAKKYKRKENSFIRFLTYETEKTIELIILDNGIGIKESNLKKVFEKGFTGENGRLNKKATGMGLYLAKKMCQQLNHEILIESKYLEFTKVKIIFIKDLYYNVLK